MPSVRALCRAYRAELVAANTDLPGIVETYYAADAFEDLLTRLYAMHRPPGGALFVGQLADEIVACGMLRRIDEATCEIKRVYVADAARGHGLARKLCLSAMAFAKRQGYRSMVLDTMTSLTGAVALYHSLGYREVDPFYTPDPRFAARIRFFGVEL